ncbi:MAG: hypothetical protein JW869_03645 [Candidatus Omnitrophica bacterium]|nr:hypothetical protein [Candidatus Omnitrophota bacterium]
MRETINKYMFLSGICLLVVMSGCAEISPPGPEEIMRQPLGQSPLRIGMSKDQIRSIWGEPDSIKVLETDAQGMVKEEWVYVGRYPNLPINVDYLSESQHLIFDGNYLVQHHHRR